MTGARRGTTATGAAAAATVVALVAGCSSSRTAPPPPAPPVQAAVAPAPVRSTPPPRPDTTSTIVTAPDGVTVYDRPDGPEKLELSGRSLMGATQTLLTVGERSGWWQVKLPVRPNDATGWIRKADVRPPTTIRTRIEIDRATHRLTFLDDGAVVARYPFVLGTRATPTPAGRFFVVDNISTPNPAGAYGPYALGLSGHSEVLYSFGSGDGDLAIHGTNAPSLLGTNASNGCIRLRNADITALRARVPLGTPVVVR